MYVANAGSGSATWHIENSNNSPLYPSVFIVKNVRAG